MIPHFPEFKRLELSDQKEVEALTAKFLPYSDFDFENMWSWDINDNVRISTLNSNLVLFTKDIFTDAIVCSYLGNTKLKETLHDLFDFLDTTGMSKSRVSLIPEDSLKGLDFGKYFIEIDLSACDYIYDLRELSNYVGNRFMQKRGRTNSFVRHYPEAYTKILDLQDKDVQEELLNLNHSWIQNKIKDQVDSNNHMELMAIERFIKADFKNVHCLGVYNKGLIGYGIFSFHGNDYAINHFMKADILYKGVYEFLMRECAASLITEGRIFLNYLEDMGLPGLRKAKLTYRPIKFLRKFYVDRL